MKKRKTSVTKKTPSVMKKSNRITTDNIGEAFVSNPEMAKALDEKIERFVASEVPFGPAVPEVGSLSAECTCPPEIREKEKHYSECPQYVEPELPPLTGLPPEVLLKALYWVHDFMDRARINFYVVGKTGEAIKGRKDLSGDTIYVAVRELEWISGARSIADAFATPLVDRGTVVEYEYDGVKVILYVLEDSETLRNFDTQIYVNEYFKLPNPYNQFEEEFKWLR